MLEGSTKFTQKMDVPTHNLNRGEQVENVSDSFQHFPEHEYYLPHKDLYLRKGKWTVSVT